MKCKHEWRQIIRMWSGCINGMTGFYCIHCLKTTPNWDIDADEFKNWLKKLNAKEVKGE